MRLQVYKTKQDLVKKKKLQDEQNYVDPVKAAEEKEKGNGAQQYNITPYYIPDCLISR